MVAREFLDRPDEDANCGGETRAESDEEEQEGDGGAEDGEVDRAHQEQRVAGVWLIRLDRERDRIFVGETEPRDARCVGARVHGRSAAGGVRWGFIDPEISERAIAGHDEVVVDRLQVGHRLFIFGSDGDVVGPFMVRGEGQGGVGADLVVLGADNDSQEAEDEECHRDGADGEADDCLDDEWLGHVA